MIKQITIAVALLCASTTIGTAQEVMFSMFSSENCLSEMDDNTNPLVCIGLSASHCMEDTDGGYSRLGTMGCFMAELAEWETRLNGSYVQMQIIDQVSDAQDSTLGPAEPALKKLQQEWTEYRDAVCAYEGMKKGGEDGLEQHTVWCKIKLTGLQTIFLRDMVKNY